MDQNQSETVSEFRDWRNVVFVISAFICFMLTVIYVYSFSVMIEPIRAEFGWSRSEINAGLSVAFFGPIIGAPMTGMLIDRIGFRRVAVPGIILYSVALALMGMVSSSIWSWWAHWALVSIGVTATCTVVWTSAISMRFTVDRGKAMAFMLCGGGAAAALSPIIASWLVDAVGWRMTYVSLAAATAIVSLPLVLALMGQDHGAGKQLPRTEVVSREEPIGRVLRSRRFICLSIAAFLISSAVMAITVNFVPMLSWMNYSREGSVLIASLIGIGSITGRIFTGFFLDRINGAWVGFGCFLVPIIGSTLLLSGIGGTGAASVAAFLIGYALGAEVDIFAYVTSRYFSLRLFGRLMGIIVSLLSIGAALGPTLAASVFDATNSYTAFLWSTVAAFGISSTLFAFLGPYPNDVHGSDGGQVAGPDALQCHVQN